MLFYHEGVYVMANSDCLFSGFDLSELVLDKLSDIGELEQNKESEDGLTGNDLHWARMHNECLDKEISIVKKFILAIKAEIRNRVRIK
jgi:hypothetical protein